MTETGLVQLTDGIAISTSLLTKMKSHLRIIGNDGDDEYLKDLIKSAEDIIENYCLTPLRIKQYRATYPAYFLNTRNMQNLYLYRNPVISVDSFTMMDYNNVAQTVTDYQLRTTKWPAVLCPLPGQFWPIARYRTLEAIVITFTAGYGEGLCPGRYSAALRALVSHMYEFREPVWASGAVPYDVPHTLQPLLDSLRYGGFL
jgi:uncharacterized phiE125 gp8 family phage protein